MVTNLPLSSSQCGVRVVTSCCPSSGGGPSYFVHSGLVLPPISKELPTLMYRCCTMKKPNGVHYSAKLLLIMMRLLSLESLDLRQFI